MNNTKFWDLDSVEIPSKTSLKYKLFPTVTIVSIVDSSPYATVECFKVNSDNPYGESILLEIPILELVLK